MSVIKRPTWDEIHMMHAILAATRSSCLIRAVGAALVRDNRVIASGYNGAPAAIENCLQKGECYYQAIAWEDHKKGHGEFAVLKEACKHLCIAVHAEANATSQLAKFGPSSVGATLYTTNYPCPSCARVEVIAKGIVAVKVHREYLSNPLVTMDEQRESERLLYQAKIPISYVELSEERMQEILILMLSVGKRTEYKFTPKGV